VTLEPPFPFVVGVNRSGTTLLRMMLDAHPELTIPPETHFVPDLIEACREGRTVDDLVAIVTGQREWEDFGIDAGELRAALERVGQPDPGGSVRAFFELYAARTGKPRYGDKTPSYGRSMTAIAAALPESRFIHVIRDGRDVFLSIRDRSPVRRPPERVARRWRRRIVDAREQARGLDHYAEVRYEELVQDPESALRRLCEFVELPWDPAMLAYHRTSRERLGEMERPLPQRGARAELSLERRMETHERVTQPPDPARTGRWRSELSAEERSGFESVAGDLLAELGYASGEAG
jgi:hypothetical protein